MHALITEKWNGGTGPTWLMKLVDSLLQAYYSRRYGSQVSAEDQNIDCAWSPTPTPCHAYLQRHEFKQSRTEGADRWCTRSNVTSQHKASSTGCIVLFLTTRWEIGDPSVSHLFDKNTMRMQPRHYWYPVLVSSANKVFFTCYICCTADIQAEANLRFNNVTINRWDRWTLIYFIKWAFLLLLLRLILIDIHRVNGTRAEHSQPWEA